MTAADSTWAALLVIRQCQVLRPQTTIIFRR